MELSTIYIKIRDFQNAYKSYVNYKGINDEIFNENSNRKVIEIQIQYEVDKKEKEIEFLKLNKNINDLKLKKYEINKNIYLFGLSFVIGLILLLYNRYRLKTRINREINVKNLELMEAHERLEILARTDHLTGIPNRRYILEKIKDEINRFERHGEYFSVILGDVDNFKIVNDEYGHDFGDLVLIEIAKRIQKNLRKQDSVARWGGEEFLLLLPNTDLEGEGF